MTPDEVRMLSNDNAILLIRGEKPIIDRKYDILKHPNVKYTTDGIGKIYEHGKTDKAIASIFKLEEINTKDIKELKEEIKDTTYELLSEEDIENYYLMEEYEYERKKENN